MFRLNLLPEVITVADGVNSSDRNCKSGCENCSKKGSCPSWKEPLNEHSSIKNVIGIISGKGGVGKSTVTSILARKLTKMGYRVGILDADITGPSIPKMFGIEGKAETLGDYIKPAVTSEGIRVISMNLLLDDMETPVLYRGPIISSFVKQFWSNVIWGELDYMLIDMPPGTGDVPLTVYQSLPIDGVIMVTSPQNLVKMIVMKAVNMAEKMNIPLLGIVENYSFFTCPDCGKEYKIFGESSIEELAFELNTEVIAKLPILPEIALAADSGSGFFDSLDIDMSPLMK